MLHALRNKSSKWRLYITLVAGGAGVLALSFSTYRGWLDLLAAVVMTAAMTYPGRVLSSPRLMELVCVLIALAFIACIALPEMYDFGEPSNH